MSCLTQFHDGLDRFGDDGRALDRCMMNAQRFTDNFESALHLFRHVRTAMNSPDATDAMRGWIHIPARDAAISVYNFANAIGAAQSLANKCRKMRHYVDRSPMREANKALAAQFPKFEGVRNAIAHGGENSKSPEHFEKNSIDGDIVGFGFNIVGAKSTMIIDAISNDHFMTTHNGELIGYDINEKSLSVLRTAFGLYQEGLDAVLFTRKETGLRLV